MFDIDLDEKAKIRFRIKKFLLSPEFWEDTNNHLTNTLTWNNLKFELSNYNNIPEQKGIYCFVVKPGVPNFFETRYLFYIGETTRTLKKRFKEYLDDQIGKGKPRPKIFEMLKLYKNNLYFYYTEISDDKEIHDTEDKLLNTFIPFVNTDIPKAKIKTELKNIYES